MYLFEVLLLVATINVSTGQYQSTNSSKDCDWPSSAGIKPTAWREEEIPNPRDDVCLCGRHGKQSWVCDPNGIISEQQADGIDREIEKLMSDTGGCHCGKKCSKYPSYHGYRAGVVFVQQMYIRDRSPTASDKREAADDITDYLRDDEWEFGLCDDDLVILVSDTDRFVYTATGDEIAGIVTDKCVKEITANNKDYLSNKDYGKAVENMIQEYTVALKLEHSCNKPLSPTSIGIIIGALAAAFGGCVCCVFLKRKFCPGVCKSSGGGSSNSSGYKYKARSRSHSASSQSSGGGGGEF